MCGIAGVYGLEDSDLLTKFSKELHHRGPDAEGTFLDSDISMIIRRLSIIDLKSGDQPKYSEDKDIVVTFNGEIYNYKELTKQLINLDHKFESNSDTEVIAHSYEQWGNSCFNKFDGMFAIALFIKSKKTLILVRDQFGIKPLYYAIKKMKNKNLFLYSSEIKPILKSNFVKTLPNDEVLYKYLKFRVHDDSKETFFKNIYKLLPGELVIINSKNIKFHKYFDLKKLNKKTTDSNFFDILKESIDRRLVADVPVGSCLSGGIDSSAVVSIINLLMKNKSKLASSLGNKQNTFSAVFPKSNNDENYYIDLLIKNNLKINSHKIYPTSEDFLLKIKDFVRTQEEPTISTGPFAQYKVMEEASKHVKVVLDGQGSDEMLAGYNPYYFVYFRQLLKERKFIKLLIELLCSMDIIIKTIFNQSKRLRFNLLNNDFENKYKHVKFLTINNDLKERLKQDIFQNSLPALLRYEDKNSMRFSIEGRVPFCNLQILEYILNLEDKNIINFGVNKNILRQSLKSIIPEVIRNRRNKIGFTTPENEWFEQLYPFIYKILTSEKFGKRKYFNQVNTVKALNLLRDKKYDDTLFLWRILNTELWLREFIDKHEKIEALPKISRIISFVNNTEIFKILTIKTKVFKEDKEYLNDYSQEIKKIINDKTVAKNLLNNNWFLVISEKAIAVSQGRSYYLWDIKPRFSAKILSKFVYKNPGGIGLRSPYTMELAIREVGIYKILVAASLSFLTKLVGKKGIFYKVLGRKIASIDGPTPYSIYPSNVSAKLGPYKPNQTTIKINERVKAVVKSKSKFLGTVIIDANDLGQNVLGNTTNIKNSRIEEIFSKNPMGQSDEQTPIAIVILK